jgi:diguanylate cyclase (GGDEF)-like protein
MGENDRIVRAERLVASLPARWASPRLVRSARAGLAVVVVALAVCAATHRSSVAGVPLIAGVGLACLGSVVAGVVLHCRDRDLPTAAGRIEPLWLLGAGLVVLLVTAGGIRTGGSSGPAAAGLLLASLAAYPFLALALLRLISGRMSGRDADMLVDGGLAATVFGLAMWVALQPLTHHAGHTTVALIVARVVLPALDVGLLTLIGRLLLLPGERLSVYRYLGLAAAYLLGAHLIAAVGTFGTVHSPASALRVLLVCSFGFWGLAALDPSVRRLFEPLTADPPAFSPGHTTLVCGAMLTVPVVVTIEGSYHLPVSTTVAIGAALSAPVLAGYVATLLWERARIERRAQHDSLTGLPNRTLFLDRLARAVAHAVRNEGTVAVMFIDLDKFKEVNDTFGHPAGDQLLVEVAARMRRVLRDEDTVARIGGDEFAILLPHVADFEGVVTVAEKLMAAIRRPIALGVGETLVTPSIGISVFPQDGEEAEQLVSSADAAMYRAKEDGRNTYEIFSPELRTRAHERLALEAGLYRAMEQDELVVYYQPQVDVRSGLVVGAEALVRWNHPDQGLLLPGEFIPIAEQSGLVVALGELVLRTACAQTRAWQLSDLPPIVMSVNVSARQFRQGIVDTTAAALRQTGLDPRWLELELTESAAVENVELTIQALGELRAMGVGCAIDDFGTGYCGLKYLSQLPISALKIDKSFVQAMSVRDAAIVTAIINLGHGLGLRVIAEGVESQAQLDCLTGQECDEVQGFLFSRPVPAEQFAEVLADQANRQTRGVLRSGTLAGSNGAGAAEWPDGAAARRAGAVGPAGAGRAACAVRPLGDDGLATLPRF